MSNAIDCREAPIRDWSSHDVEGSQWFGVAVVTIRASTSPGAAPAFSSAARAARSPMSTGVISSDAKRRSRMPVRSTIHSLLVSTIRSRSALVRTRSGR